MAMFRSLRPSVLQAYQYDGTRESARAISRWTGGRARLRGAVVKGDVITSFALDRLSGEVEIRPTDWVAQLGRYDFAAYSPDEFGRLYSPATDAASCEAPEDPID